MQPADVHLLLAGDVPAERLQSILSTLRSDPAWVLLDPLVRETEWLFQMVHQPTGRPLGFTATQIGEHLWAFPPIPCAGWLGPPAN